MTALSPHRVVALNTSTASANKIHDDDTARRFGFRGGLVPGVDVYAYLTHPPVAAWGMDWLRHGTMRARFHQPVYDGEQIHVEVGDGGTLELRNPGGELCATAEAARPDRPAAPPDPTAWPEVESRSEPAPASPATLTAGTVFGLAPHTFRADRAGEYLDDVRETLPVYTRSGIAHPAWLLRDANYVLSANVRLGPWIHVESVAQHHDVVHDGESVQTRGRVVREWANKGHRFVELDVLVCAEGRPVMQIEHTAIYEPRRLDR